MNYQTVNRASAAAIGLIFGSVIFAFITVGIKLTVPAPANDADRAAGRSKALAEIRAAEDISLNHPAVIDAKRGIVRLPIETAMALAAQMWQNPSAARAGLNSRAEKAVAPVKTESFE
jgi:hypothetical protein